MCISMLTSLNLARHRCLSEMKFVNLLTIRELYSLPNYRFQLISGKHQPYLIQKSENKAFACSPFFYPRHHDIQHKPNMPNV